MPFAAAPASASPSPRAVRVGLRSGPVDGQSTAELAMVLPVLMVAFLVVVQIGVVARDQVLVHHAVREAARQVALDPSEASARTAALAAAPSLDDDRLSVVLVGGTDVGQIATIELRYQAPTRVPVVGAFLGDVPLRTDASVRIE